MLEAKLPLTHIVDILSKQHSNESISVVLKSIKKNLQNGQSLVQACSRFPLVFSNFYLSMIKVGEMTGRLDFMMERTAVYLELMNELRNKLIQALAYPVLVITVASAAVIFLLTYVVPTFADMFRDFGAELPAITVGLMNISAFITKYSLYLFIAVIFLYIIIVKYKNTKYGKKRIDKLILTIPVIGPILVKIFISRFARTLGILLESGIPLLQALIVCSNSMSNTAVQQEIIAMYNSAQKGGSLAYSLQRSRVFPLMVTQMISVGEETAKMDKMLLRISDYYDREIEASLNLLSSIFEPLIIVFLGLILGTILVALYMPLFNLANIVPG